MNNDVDMDVIADHQPGESTPHNISAPMSTPAAFGLQDQTWDDQQWLDLLSSLVASKFFSWKEVAALVLGHLNPSQVGTSLASSKGFQRNYGKGSTMRIVMEWMYQQTGQCADCGTRLELQADHIQARESFLDPLDADTIENIAFRCRRCNVIRRPSHEFGGLTHLTAEAALMWILLVIKPRNLQDFIRLCRLYRMTMSDIRMQEGWAMAHWLAHATPPSYGIEDDANSAYDIVLWPDAAITRVDLNIALPDGAVRLYANVQGDAVFGFLTEYESGRVKYHNQPISFIPFSTYDLGNLPPQSLAIRYTPPDRINRTPQRLSGLPPRGMTLLSHAIRKPQECFCLVRLSNGQISVPNLLEAPPHVRLINTKLPASECQLQAVSATVLPVNV